MRSKNDGNTTCGQSAEFFNYKGCVKYRNHQALKGQTYQNNKKTMCLI
jgi:hypothetical protein